MVVACLQVLWPIFGRVDEHFAATLAHKNMDGFFMLLTRMMMRTMRRTMTRTMTRMTKQQRETPLSSGSSTTMGLKGLTQM